MRHATDGDGGIFIPITNGLLHPSDRYRVGTSSDIKDDLVLMENATGSYVRTAQHSASESTHQKLVKSGLQLGVDHAPECNKDLCTHLTDITASATVAYVGRAISTRSTNHLSQ